MTAVLLTPPRMYFYDSNGNPLAGGLVYSYTAGTSTPQNTYTTSAGNVANANPVTLDSSGGADIWINGSYKIVVKDSGGNTISTTDNITAFNNSATSTFTDAQLIIQDDGDNTKQLQFQCSSISPSSTTIVTIPDGSTTMVGTDRTQTLTNKTLTAAIHNGATTFVGNSDVVQLDMTANATQTNPIFRIKQNGGGALFRVNNSGLSEVIGYQTIAPFTDNIGLLITGNGTQTNPLLQIKNNGGTSLFKVDNSGTVTKNVNFAMTTPADPTGTTSTTGVMMGLAGALTPTGTGKVRITLTGSYLQNTNADGGKFQLYYGTSTAPANAAALTGTTAGNIISWNVTTAASARHAFCLTAIVSGLTLSTAYWFDVGLAAVTGGTASIKDLTLIVEEL